MEIFAGLDKIAYLNEIRVLSDKQERNNVSISQILAELEGEDAVIFGLEGLSYNIDTPYVVMPWAIAAILGRKIGAEAKIIHTGEKWQGTNNIPSNVAKQASDVRKGIFSAYMDDIYSDITNVSSDGLNDALQNYEYLKYVYDHPRDSEVQTDFKKRFGNSAEGAGRFRRQVKSVSNGFGPDYTLHEIAANMAIIESAKDEGLLPVKISFENQAVDYLLERDLDLDVYILRFPLPKHPSGKGVVPYSVPGNGDTKREEYILIGDTPETLREKVTSGFRSKGHNLHALVELHSYLSRTPLNGKGVYSATSAIGNCLHEAAKNAGGYPLEEFMPAWKVFKVQ